jgi:hypothetical protein
MLDCVYVSYILVCTVPGSRSLETQVVTAQTSQILFLFSFPIAHSDSIFSNSILVYNVLCCLFCFISS